MSEPKRWYVAWEKVTIHTEVIEAETENEAMLRFKEDWGFDGLWADEVEDE